MPLIDGAPQKLSQGFSLVEVMIASLILLVGITGFATMQNRIMQSEKSLDLHAKAVQIAKQKMAELSYFERNQTDDGKTSYQSIADDKGGASAAGEIEIIENAHTDNSAKFKQHWQVTEQYYVDSDDDGKADKWVNDEDKDAPAPLPSLADRKAVTVKVSWLGSDGKTQQYELSGFIAPIPTNRSFHVFHKTPEGNLVAKNQISMTSQKNLVKHKLDEDLVQASLPIKFDEKTKISTASTIRLVLDEDSKHATIQQQREFAFAQCRCALSTETKAKTPAQVVIDGNQLAIKKGLWKIKASGIAEPGQSPLCSSCCRDHHDTKDMLTNQNYYRNESGSAHKHFKVVSEGKYISASKIGDQYDEVCRFERVDGDFELLADLHSLQTISFLKNQMTEEFSNQYQQYVSNLIKSHVLEKALPLSPLENTLLMSPSAAQLELRSIYVERLQHEDNEVIKKMLLDGDSDWQSLIPFLDFEITMQAIWNSSNELVAKVSNQPKQSVFSPEELQYASYSKGRLIALMAGSSELSNEINKGNEGLIGSPSISMFNQYQTISSRVLQLKVKGGDTPGLIVDIFCTNTEDDIQQPCNEKQLAQISKLKMAPEKSEFSCNIEMLTNPNTSFFSCSNAPKGWLGKIVIDTSLLESSVNLVWRDPSEKTTMGTSFGLIKPLIETSHSDYWLIVEFDS
ncbi:type IV pilus modification PilV family protein [Aliiglaciecola lipolytica]|uniref:type IV pilus modification PilV family protein n=1 Tax=Aliiglaciecola lipolytica TaxID=477689 RepID=UPI001C0997EF|nr:prepilin-type N-terminal cleavage/methylation domain-containing protein [Aliiglaciecola lipolytica]MBU2879694.1 prepilin-type N-terminal cleavage/methylation domain-containing protein [Aliiglaciecola lipolytica]